MRPRDRQKQRLVDLNPVNNMKHSPFHIAVVNNNLPMLQILVDQYKCDILGLNAEDYNGLDLAENFGHASIC